MENKNNHKQDENKDNLKLQNGESQHHYMMFGLSIGMCFGASLGVMIGQFLFDNMSIGIAVGASIGMLLGLAFGMMIDNKRNGGSK